MQQNDPVKDPIQQNNPAKICPTCFHENAGDARFCTNCNKRLPGRAATQNESPARPPDQTASPQKPDELPVVKKVPFPKQRLQPKKGLLVLSALALALVTVSLLGVMVFKITHIPPTQSLSGGSGEVMNANGHSIGVNDGSFAPFDVGRQDQALKQQAAAALKGGNSAAALSLWHQALTINSNDAEALIYIEDQRILASGEPHITLIAGVAFTPPFPDGSSESDLQGIYVAQSEFNAQNHGFQLRILIANAGDNAPDTTAIVQQIVRIANGDTTVVGVIGWRYSSYSLLAIPVLAAKKIPLISPQSTSDELTGISPHYFFRVVAPNKEEVQIATPFAEKTLGFKHPVIFFDPQDSYSQNLAQGFSGQFKNDGYTDIHEEPFTTDAKNQKANFSELIQNAAQYQPDGFIFTGRSNADSGFFQDALPTSGPMAHINVLAGSGSYTAHKNSRGRWYFIAVAYHGANNTSSIAQQFADDYRKDFSDSNPNHIYYYKIADDHVMVAYDATALTLKAILNTGKTNPTSEDLARELPNMKGTKAFQGVSGQISFGSKGNPINKTLFILFVPLSGGIQLVSVCSINAGCHK
jgi:eukaryotic-like serine/threonine-protein kinase